ncbi:MAG: type II toxin-antitoxin system RelE/ParE family toxin [Parvibaculaceae bacterium]
MGHFPPGCGPAGEEDSLDHSGRLKVRRIVVGNYELRYEVADTTIFVLRLWHCRENRSAKADD